MHFYLLKYSPTGVPDFFFIFFFLKFVSTFIEAR
jgi:hypothetical protein